MTTTRKSKRPDRLYKQVFRIIISFLDYPKNIQFKGKKVLRQKNIRPDLQKQKAIVLDSLLQKEKDLQFYKIAWETHERNLLPHLDILLTYSKRVKKHDNSYNYLLPHCPQVLSEFPNDKQVPQTRIVGYTISQLSSAVLDYGQKEDPQPLSNFTQQNTNRYIVLNKLKQDAYGFLQQEMKKDPYNFDLAEYVEAYDLASVVHDYNSVKSKLLDIRAAVIARLELSKPGFHRITPQLIRQRLTPSELQHFELFKDKAYQTIIDHLNQICQYGPKRPHKTSNLFLVGPKNTGKTALTEVLAKTVGRYNVKYENKYLNRYSNNKYGFIVWNEVKFTDFSHNWILQFLEGIEVAIPMRYNSCLKKDNPLIILTSNLSLQQHVKKRFSDSKVLYKNAMQNLGARITQVHIPKGHDIFFLQKLIIPADKPIQ